MLVYRGVPSASRTFRGIPFEGIIAERVGELFAAT